MGFSRQEYWSGLPFPSPGDLPDPGMEPRSPALQEDALTSEPPGKPYEILLSHKKKHNWVSSNEVYEPRTYYTEWRKSERERQISYINTYIQNLERWYWRIYLQGSNGETVHTVHGVLKARILKWFAIPFSSGPHFARPLHHDPSILGGPTQHGPVSLS